MSTKARIQEIQAEIEAHERRGWLKGYEEGLAVREQQIVDLQSAILAYKEQIRELRDAVKKRNEQIQELGKKDNIFGDTREALEIEWDLAHPVKVGQVIPAGTRHLYRGPNYLFASTFNVPYEISDHIDEKYIRTIGPLPDPEPEWLNAPAVVAIAEGFSYRRIWFPVRDGYWASIQDGRAHWSELRDVTPLYPKGQDA